jgi:hypothetical protein
LGTRFASLDPRRRKQTDKPASLLLTVTLTVSTLQHRRPNFVFSITFNIQGIRRAEGASCFGTPIALSRVGGQGRTAQDAARS